MSFQCAFDWPSWIQEIRKIYEFKLYFIDTPYQFFAVEQENDLQFCKNNKC